MQARPDGAGQGGPGAARRGTAGEAGLVAERNGESWIGMAGTDSTINEGG
jgi:hypothetical protein